MPSDNQFETAGVDAFGERHGAFMRRCIDLGRQALPHDVPVGALVVRDNAVIAEGVESVRATLDVTAHAEIIAVRAACASLGSTDLSGCTLYTTVEPCVMCAYAIRLARISMVVAGTQSSDAEATCNGVMILTDGTVLRNRPVPLLMRGVLERECAALLKERDQ